MPPRVTKGGHRLFVDIALAATSPHGCRHQDMPTSNSSFENDPMTT